MPPSGKRWPLLDLVSGLASRKRLGDVVAPSAATIFGHRGFPCASALAAAAATPSGCSSKGHGPTEAAFFGSPTGLHPALPAGRRPTPAPWARAPSPACREGGPILPPLVLTLGQNLLSYA